MKCINKITAFLLCMVLLVSQTACGKVEISSEYSVFKSSIAYGVLPDPQKEGTYFGSDKCIATKDDVGKDHSGYAEGYGVFDDTDREVKSAHNIMKKMYPASTTKILTAYIALTQANKDQIFVVSDSAYNTTRGTSTCGLLPGDKIALNDLLYGLMLNSGNDAAVTIAEGISGSVDEFAKLMNETARSLGATHSNFVNPHGLPDDRHFTCIYDMYLIFHAAINTPGFTKLIKTKAKKVKYMHADGKEATAEYHNTNQFVSGLVSAPKGISVIGGKTGTTNAAGYCLVLYSKTKKSKHKLISIVYKAVSRPGLYQVMGDILTESK